MSSGPPDSGEGFAAGFVCGGMHLAGLCSLRTCIFAKETSELASTLYAGLAVGQARANVSSAIFYSHSQNAVRHVFAEEDPGHEHLP